jgi:hypothetical protein
MGLTYYTLDPANCLPAASLAWGAALLETKIELALITNKGVLTMIEISKRGGPPFVGAKRYAKANNKHMCENYDSTQESSHIKYVDANNLYGWAMVQPFPYKDIEFEEIVSPTLETRYPETFRTISEETRPATLQTVSEETSHRRRAPS